MKLYIIIILLFSFIQPALGRQYTIDKTTDKISITQYELFKDQSNVIPADVILSKSYLKKFKPKFSIAPDFSFKHATYWIKFSILNKNRKITKMILVVDENILLSKFSLHYKNSKGKIISKNMNFEELNHRFSTTYFKTPYNIPINYYLAVEAKGRPLEFQLICYIPESFISRLLREYTIITIFFCVMTVVFLYSILVGFITKEKIHFAFSLFIFVYTLLQMFLLGVAQQLFWRDFSLNIAPIMFLLALNVITTLIFSYSLFKIKTKILMNSIFILLCLGSIFQIIASLFELGPSFIDSIKLIPILYSSMIITVIGLGIHQLITGNKSILFYIISWIPFIFGISIHIMETEGVLGYSILYEYAIMAGSLGQVLIISIGLSSQLHLINKEKLKAQRQSKLVIDYSPLPIAIYDNYKITYINKTFTDIFGYSIHQLHDINKLITTMIPQKEEQEHFRYLISTKEKEPFEFSIVCADNTLRQIEFRIVLIDSIYFAIMNDLTDMRIAEEKIKNSLIEKEILLKEIHHRVKNNLQLISSLINLHSTYNDKENYYEVLQESQSKILSMALVHEILYNSGNFDKIDFKKYTINLSKQLLQLYGADHNNITLDLDIDEISLKIEMAIPCGILITEILLNSIKYAFPSQREGIITIKFKHHSNNEIQLYIGDNGISLPEGFELEKSNTLGFQLITSLVDQLKGRFMLDLSIGTVYTI